MHDNNTTMPLQLSATAGKLVKGQQQTTHRHPYQSLLQLYLSRFLPRNAEPRSGTLVPAAKTSQRVTRHIQLSVGDPDCLNPPKEKPVLLRFHVRDKLHQLIKFVSLAMAAKGLNSAKGSDLLQSCVATVQHPRAMS